MNTVVTMFSSGSLNVINESSTVFSSKINIIDVVNTAKYMDNIKGAAKANREALLKVDFGF